LAKFSVDSNKRFDNKCLELVCDQWPELENLNISDTPVTGEGLKQIKRLKNLKELAINTLALTDEDMEPVFTLSNLKILHFMLNGITDKTLERLAAMPSLEFVEAHHCKKLTANGLAKLRAHKINVESMVAGQDTMNHVVDFLGN
jgi:hypothetical protein